MAVAHLLASGWAGAERSRPRNAAAPTSGTKTPEGDGAGVAAARPALPATRWRPFLFTSAPVIRPWRWYILRAVAVARCGCRRRQAIGFALSGCASRHGGHLAGAEYEP